MGLPTVYAETTCEVRTKQWCYLYSSTEINFQKGKKCYNKNMEKRKETTAYFADVETTEEYKGYFGGVAKRPLYKKSTTEKGISPFL
jgi:hypothetical protein